MKSALTSKIINYIDRSGRNITPIFDNILLVIGVVVWFIFSIVLLWFSRDMYWNLEQANILYLLSALSQGMAAVFAIIFTIILVYTQIAKYTMGKLILDVPTILYATLFIFNILSPIFVLWFKVETIIPYILSSSVLSFTLIFWFITHTQNLYDPINIVGRIGKLYRVKSQNKSDYDFNDIHEIIIKAYKFSDIRIYYLAMFEMVERLKENYRYIYSNMQWDLYNKLSYNFGFKDAIYRFREICERVFQDSRSINVIYDRLLNISNYKGEIGLNDWNKYFHEILDLIIYIRRLCPDGYFQCRSHSTLVEFLIKIKKENNNLFKFLLGNLGKSELVLIHEDLNRCKNTVDVYKYLSIEYRKENEKIVKEIMNEIETILDKYKLKVA
ncbi:MAG: hypothetical protein H8D45_01295 [Bacteroidetes bacterium]|nr:hypothetical protein [Bacteroidota bacterium]MBL7067115.1 hypothetical protein [Candidatus Neomarinimicrobiota bacterium]